MIPNLSLGIIMIKSSVLITDDLHWIPNDRKLPAFTRAKCFATSPSSYRSAIIKTSARHFKQMTPNLSLRIIMIKSSVPIKDDLHWIPRGRTLSVFTRARCFATSTSSYRLAITTTSAYTCHFFYRHELHERVHRKSRYVST